MFKILAAGLRLFTMSAIQKPEVLFILGGPGAGKGTLCRYITEKYGYVHLSAGDLLREECAKGSTYARLIEDFIRNGKIVPGEITCNLLYQAMQASDNPDKRFLIDGFPRNADNVDNWNVTLGDKCLIKGVLFCECSKEVCIQRCLQRGAAGSGRIDDNEESLVKRYEMYLKSTIPIIEHFEKEGLVYKLNSMQTPEKVVEDSKEILTTIGW